MLTHSLKKAVIYSAGLIGGAIGLNVLINKATADVDPRADKLKVAAGRLGVATARKLDDVLDCLDDAASLLFTKSMELAESGQAVDDDELAEEIDIGDELDFGADKDENELDELIKSMADEVEDESDKEQELDDEDEVVDVEPEEDGIPKNHDELRTAIQSILDEHK